jgi:hypothetical protein
MSDAVGPPTEPIPPGSSTAEQPPVAPRPSIAVWGWLALLAAVALLLGLFIEENGTSLWDASEAWSLFAIACAIAQLAPLLHRPLKWSEERAWLVAVIGAGGLALYWLLIVLPVIGRNTSFAVTVAVAAATAGVWLAPGRHDPRP